MGTSLVFAAFIVVGCTFFGRSMSQAARRRVHLLQGVMRGIKMLRIHMSGMLEKLSDALIATNCAELATVGRQMDKGISANEAWMAVKPGMTSRGGKLDALSAGDIAILDELMASLGEGGRREQEVIIQNTLKQLEEQTEGAKLQLSEKERLYVTVGFLVGLMIALAVI